MKPSAVAPVRIRTVRLDSVEPQPVTWLNAGRIPFGKLTLLEGDPGLGKSTYTIDLAARVSRGLPLPGDGPREPADVVLVTYEDGLGDTIQPRLVAAGADLARVHAIAGISTNGSPERLLSIPQDVPALRQVVEETRAALLIIDPLAAALSSSTDSYKDADTRQALAPLSRMAEETNVAVLIVRHLTKGAASRAINAGGGSIAFAAAARSVLAVHVDPTDAAKRVLATVKCNLAPLAPSLSFGLEDAGNGCARVTWHGTSQLSAEDLNAARLGSVGGGPEPEAQAWLRDVLRAGERERRDVLRAGRENGFNERSLERAADRLGVEKRQSGFGTEKRSYWSLSGIPDMSDTPHAGVGIVGIGGIEAPTRQRRTVERDGLAVQQELMPTAHGDKWVDAEDAA